MKLDVRLPSEGLGDVPRTARLLEDAGFDGLFTSETHADCFLPLALAAEHTRSCTLGTAVAVALPRNPVQVAHVAHDLQCASSGRFVLGLGTQTRAHLVERYGVDASRLLSRIREFIAALRAIWTAWQTGERLSFEGAFWRHKLMPPAFRPTQITRQPPVFLAAVGPRMTQTAGELADGLIVHELHTVQSLRSETLPMLSTGLRAAGRDRAAFTTVCCVHIVTGEDEAAIVGARERVRLRLAFHAATPEYGHVLKAAGYEHLHNRLCGLARLGRWSQAAALVPDAMIEDFAVVAAPENLGQALRERYLGIADRLLLNLPPDLPHSSNTAIAMAPESQ
jgi:probable F420-dependent oxidoreductase